MKYSKTSGLTGSHLKWIAIITMFLDHIGAALLEIGLLPQIANAVLAGNAFNFLPTDYHTWYNLDLVLRYIGRLAFPLFCFLLIEGFLHTKNVKIYMLRLGLFALISEVPFDLTFNNSVLELTSQNVFFTLFIGLAVLYGLQYFEETLPSHMAPLRYLVAITGMMAAYFLQTDYDAFGVLLIVLLYELRNSRKWQCIIGAIVTFFNSYTAPLAFLFIWFYNGKRGNQLPKYFFYAFYPLHLLVLAGLRILIR